MNAYEYKTVKVPRSGKARTKALNAYGAQGWELTNTTDAWQHTVTVSLRRPLAAEAVVKPKPPSLLGLIFQALANRTAK
ncbi:hypothetical protein HYP71_gp099 [Arthrobacter phage KBurrousTX]|uniref:DUF4177 domain-containing protein n=1 Tax=Arthrobacter phage KBurrousTX TaxID=2315608 RepID=A0A386K8Q2_9CAUD|nr:hypothetical protein HYP71_gp099 [Arthrobacter phage KBurrousTX]AYD81593.1 hypothetical protein KBurrousTX_99 [Arthrobacter phage KBurrousTX]